MRDQSKQQLFQFVFRATSLVEEAEELASNVLAAGLLVVHDTSGGGQDDVAELTRGEQLDGPLLEVAELDGVAGVDDTALVETAAALEPSFLNLDGIATYRPFSWMTILPERWSSTSSNSPM